MKKNDILKLAFEEAAAEELKSLPKEEDIVRPYSKEFNKKMDKLFDEVGSKKKTVAARGKKFRWAALIAAVLMCVALTVTVSASDLTPKEILMLMGMWTEPDPDRYEIVDVELKGAHSAGRGSEARNEIVYEGKPLTFRYVIETGTKSEEAERALVLMINGVRQKFDAESAQGKQENLDEFIIGGKLGETEWVDITFEPNVGKKGETVYLSLASIVDPDDNHMPKCVTENGIKDYHDDWDCNDLCDDCGLDIKTLPRGTRAFILRGEYSAHLIMEAEAPEQKAVCDAQESGIKETDVRDIIVDMYNYMVASSDDPNDYYNEYDKLESLRAFMYKDFDEAVMYEQDGLTEGIYTVLNTDFVTEGEEKEKFTLNLHGKAGDYRVALYIDTVPQPVFDGAENIDVTLNEGKQLDIPIELNTAALSEGKHTYYVLYKKINDGLFENGWERDFQIELGTITVG